MAAHQGGFTWYDLATSDPDPAERFYSAVVGWEVKAWERAPEYRMWTADGVPLGGVSQLGEGAVPGWLAYVSVESADAAAHRVEELGGRILRGPTDIPNGGRFAVFADPQGAVLAAYARGVGDVTSVQEPAPGEFSWHELATRDPQAAAAFYTALLGWERSGDFDMGEAGLYQMFAAGGLACVGIYPSSGEAEPAWLHYVRVADLDAAVRTVAEQGGRVVMGPMEVPGGDRVATALDPQGIMFALHEKVSG